MAMPIMMPMFVAAPGMSMFEEDRRRKKQKEEEKKRRLSGWPLFFNVFAFFLSFFFYF
jgi:hypothetical protein